MFREHCFSLTVITPQLRGKLPTHHGGTQPPSGKAVTSRLEGTDLVSDFGTRESWRAGGGVLRFHRPEPSVAVRGPGGRPKRLPEGQHLDPNNTRGAEKKASGCAGVCVWGGGGQTSCPARELLPAGAGRRRVWTEFGTDCRTASCPVLEGEPWVGAGLSA